MKGYRATSMCTICIHKRVYNTIYNTKFDESNQVQIDKEGHDVTHRISLNKKFLKKCITRKEKKIKMKRTLEFPFSLFEFIVFQ